MTNTRSLTANELKVIEEFEKARPGLGAMAESNIRNNDKTGWADIQAMADLNHELTQQEKERGEK
jgi:hypothetical protein